MSAAKCEMSEALSLNFLCACCPPYKNRLNVYFQVVNKLDIKDS